MKYYIIEIAGRQHLIELGELLSLNLKAGSKNIKAKTLLAVDGEKVEFAEIPLNLEVVGKIGTKVRVATYKPKANQRTVKGARSWLTKVKLEDAKKETKKIVKKS